MLNSFLLAFAMYSKIPMPRADWSKEKMKYVMCFFPLVGAVIGALIFGFGYLCSYFGFSEIFRVCGLTLIPLLVTGGIHMDGFVDTIDALSSYQSRGRKLEILKDSHTGAFAVIFAGIYLVASLGMWSEISGNCLSVMAVSFVFSRGLSGMSVVTFKNARKDGLLATFSTSAEKYVTRVVLALYLAVSGTVMVILNWKAGILAVLAAAFLFVYYRYKSYKEFGGITGDLAGWFMQLCELSMGIAVVISGVL